MPEAFDSATLTLEGQAIEIVDAAGLANRRYVSVPSLNAVFGGVLVFSGIHVWTADTAQVPPSVFPTLALTRSLMTRKHHGKDGAFVSAVTGRANSSTVRFEIGFDDRESKSQAAELARHR